MRECTKCHAQVSFPDGFYLLRGKPTRECKECSKARAAAWNKAHPERHAAAHKKWAKANPEIRRANALRFYYNNPEKAAARRRRWAHENRDAVNAYQRAYRQENREAHIASNRRWEAANPERVRANGVNKSARRRAAFSGVVRDFTVAQWEEMKAAHEYRCAYCHEEKPLTQDHIVPIAKGGAHTRDNVAPACRSCNSSKRNHDLLPWLSARSTADLQPRCS